MVRLGVTLAVDVIAGHDPGQEVGHLLGRAVRQDGRPDEPLAHASLDPRDARAHALLGEHQHLDRREPASAVLDRPAGADQVRVREPALPLLVLRAGERLRAVIEAVIRQIPLGHLGQARRHVVADPAPDLHPEVVRFRTQVGRPDPGKSLRCAHSPVAAPVAPPP
jgi:hypothetical protein